MPTKSVGLIRSEVLTSLPDGVVVWLGLAKLDKAVNSVSRTPPLVAGAASKFRGWASHVNLILHSSLGWKLIIV